MPVAIPLVPSDPNYRIGTVLLDTDYLIDMRWNARASAWYMSLLDADGSIIRSNMKLVLGTAIGRASADPRFPNGFFLVTDLTGSGTEATFDDLGTRVQVFFFEYSS